MYRCCMFDLDGTLLNTIHALTLTTNKVLEQYGLGNVDMEHMRLFVGNGYKKQVERSLIYAGDKELVHYEAALKTYMEVFAANCMYKVEPYDGILEMLEFIKKQGIKLAVLSNKPNDRTIENIEGVFGAGYFDAVAGDQEGVPKKPDPAGVFLLTQKLGVMPSECLYFGDTNTDMETGIGAGMDTAGVTWGFRDRAELEAYHPKYLIDSPHEVEQIIRRYR